MAEVKNSFLGSKMNKDLDDRLIPNNEYRDALNISIGKSEGDSIGVAQISLGNIELKNIDGTNFETLPGLNCIGSFSDTKHNRIYQFLTDYEDQTPSLIVLPDATKTMKITVYDPAASPTYRTLVSGTFLNFSKTNIITGVNLVEDLLFFTDNRNQPRKINVTSASSNPSYYYNETQISVAKYAPIDPISLIRKETATVVSGTAGGADWVLSNMTGLACTIGPVAGAPTGPYTATITTAVLDGFVGFLVGDVIAGSGALGSGGGGPVIITSLVDSTTINVSSINIFSAGAAVITLRYPYVGAIQIGATVLSSSPGGTQFLRGSDYAFVKSINNTTLSLYEPTTEIAVGYTLTFLNSTMSNQANTPGWPGDPSFIEDKFIRFSYRFKFDDNEYSLLAPFTQIAYIPKQKGYFIEGDEADAYQSTVVKWFENNINNIELLIPFPDKLSSVNNSYKITDLDILYKESDAIVAYVIDTIPSSKFVSTTNSNIYTYSYQSQKPYKTLNPDQITRVYDNVPVRALAQDVSGNRVIYGNFHTTYVAPREIDYNTSVTPKQDIFDNFIEYPNHTVKQNRNYQVGFVLSDKFGRASSVILSSVDAKIATGDSSTLSIGGSTLYAPYQSEGQANFPDVKEWFGNALTLLINNEISSVRDIPNGTPGLYAIPASNSGFSILAGATINVLDNGFYRYRFTLNTGVGIVNVVPVIGQYLRGKYTDYVTVVNVTTSGGGNIYNVFTDQEINNLYLFDPSIGGIATKYAYILNQIGWYSYKVVVKQQQQDYYNVYLPGMLQGYPEGQTYGSQVIYTGVGPTATSTLENGVNTTTFPVGELQKTSHIVLINDNINKVPRDLQEVGPDQKQYRSSVSLFGKVQNKAAIVNLVSLGTINNQLENTLQYNTLDPLNAGAIDIIIGDSIQNDGANTPIPAIPATTPPTTMPNPDRWYADTVVTSHVIVGTTGTIKFAPNNITQNSSTVPGAATYKNFTITRAENVQYFPTRKGDVVSSIATSTDFNFIANDVTNRKGTSAINFYQLQTNPLIGRVSTVNPIGVVASKMIPFLSVYETTPDVSALALFWETATTGYVSDLNWDVLTGFDGPSRLSEFEFNFWENQNPNGTDPVQGEPDSKYITGAFQVLNATGLPLALNSIQLTNVSPDNATNLPKFALETIGNSYRLYITNYFTFNSGAATNSNFTFTITVDYQGTLYPLYITGRLKNKIPSFTLQPAAYNRTIGRVVADVVTMTAVNGSTNVPSNTQDLSWDIISVNVPPYFSIGALTGIVRLENALIPIGVYPLTIRVRDAMNVANNPPTPLFLAGSPNLSTKEATIDIFITVGEKPVNSGLSYFNTFDLAYDDSWCYTMDPVIFNGSSTINCNMPGNAGDWDATYPGMLPGQGVCAVYVGTKDVTLTVELGPYVAVEPFPPGAPGDDVFIRAWNNTPVFPGYEILVSGTQTGTSIIDTYNNVPKTYWVAYVGPRLVNGANEFSLSETNGGPAIGLTNGTVVGVSMLVINDAGGRNINLPNPTSFYQAAINVENYNGKQFGSLNPPVGLTQGELEWIVENQIKGNKGQNRSNKCAAWLYHRATALDPWVLIRDANGVLPSYDPTTTQIGDAGLSPTGPPAYPTQTQNAFNGANFNLAATSPDGGLFWPTGSSAEKQIKFVSNIVGEYCLVMKDAEYLSVYAPTGGGGIPDDFGCNYGNQSGMNCIVKDANYNYPAFEPEPGEPLPPAPQKYFLAGRTFTPNPAVLGYPTGTPYNNQNALREFASAIPASPIALNPLVGNRLYLTAGDYQFVAGMKYRPTTTNITGTSATVGGITTVTVAAGQDTKNIFVGMLVTVVSGTLIGSGFVQAGTIVTSVPTNTTFEINLVPSPQLSGRPLTATNAWFTGTGGLQGIVITDFENGGLTFVLSEAPTLIPGGIPAGAKIIFGFGPVLGGGDRNPNGLENTLGVVYATSVNPMNVKQFFTDTTLSTPWFPPVPDKIYNFQSAIDFGTGTGYIGLQNSGLIKNTKFPYFSAKFDVTGKVIQLPVPYNTVVTTQGNYTASGTPYGSTVRYDALNRARNIYQNLSVSRN